MRYPPEHKEQTRVRLLEVGGALAKQDGFGSTSIDGLAAAVGVTSGAFYSHFRSKADLLGAIVESELTRSLALLANKSDEELLAAVESYLGVRHVDNPAQGCAATSLSPEVARSGPETKRIFERMMLQIRDQLASHLSSDDEAWVMISQMVGAVTIARAMTSGVSREDLLEAVSRQCRKMVSSAR